MEESVSILYDCNPPGMGKVFDVPEVIRWLNEKSSESGWKKKRESVDLEEEEMVLK